MSEKRAEVSTRKWIIKELDAVQHICAAIKSFVTADPRKFIEEVEANGSPGAPADLQIFGLLHALSVVFIERRDQMSAEDCGYIVASLIDDDHNLHLMEGLTMHISAPIVAQATQLLIQALGLLHFGHERSPALAIRQKKILTMTTILLWNIRLAIGAKSRRQQKLSIHLLSLLASYSSECTGLMLKMFPKSLFRKVQVGMNIAEWKPENWREFFYLLEGDLSSGTEQWNAGCRRELDARLRDIALDYFLRKHCGAESHSKDSFIRWNYEDFGMEYAGLREKCKVGKYYLRDLLKLDEHGCPFLSEPITLPNEFWKKLESRFMNSTDLAEKRLLLQVITLVYKEHYGTIKEIKVLPHFVNLLNMEQAKSLHGQLLELMLATISVGSAETAMKNSNKLIKAGGLTFLINLLSRVYVEGERMGRSRRIGRALNIISIFDVMLKLMDKRFVYPVAPIRGFLERKGSVTAILQTLLIESEQLRKHTMRFVRDHLLNAHKLLVEAGIVDFLILCVDACTGLEALGLLSKLQLVHSVYNTELDLSPMCSNDKCLINRYSSIKQSLYLRFLPVPFIKYIFEEPNIENVLGVYLTEDVLERPVLIWTREMRLHLERHLHDHTKNLKEFLSVFVSTKSPNFRRIESMPQYCRPYSEVVKYPHIAREICCGEYYLRVWNSRQDLSALKSEEVFYEDLEATFREVTEHFPEFILSDLNIVVNSYTLAFNQFNTKATFQSFPMLLNVVDFACDSIEKPDMNRYLKNFLKFVCRSTKVGGNSSAFEAVEGCVRVITVLQKWLRYLEHVQYAPLCLVDLAGMRWGLVIILESIDRAPVLWNSIEYKLREGLLKRLFELNYFLQHTLCNSEMSSTLRTKHRVKFCLNYLLKMQKYSRPKDVDLSAHVSEQLSSSYTLSSIIHTMEISYLLLTSVSQSMDSQREVVLSGWGLLGVHLLFVRNSNNYDQLRSLFDLGYMQAIALMPFRNMAGFVVNLRAELAEPLASFGDSVLRMVGDYFINLIVSSLEVVAHRIRQPGLKAVVDKLLVAIEMLLKNLEHPQCIWNESTRAQMKAAVDRQLELYHSSPEVDDSNYATGLKELEYAAHKDEVVVDGVFIRVLNKDPYGRIVNPTRILKSVISELERVQVAELESNSELLSRTSMLFEALNNIITFQQLIEFSVLTRDYIRVLCRFFDPGLDEVPKHKERIYLHVLSFLIELAKDSRQAAGLLGIEEFLRFAFLELIRLKHEPVVKRLLACFEGILAQRECDELVFAKGGLIIFLLHAMCSATEKRYRHMFLNFAQQILTRRKTDKRFLVLINLIPAPILDKFVDPDFARVDNLIGCLDQDARELYLVWNSSIRDKVVSSLGEEVGAIESGLVGNSEIQDWRQPTEQRYSAVMNIGEIVVGNVVLTALIENPYVKFKTPYTTFLNELMDQTRENLELLAAYRSSIDKGRVAGEEEKEKEKEEVKSFADMQEVSEHFQQGINCVLTALMLSYEQIFKNSLFNLNKVTEAMLKKSVESAVGSYCRIFSGEAVQEVVLLGFSAVNTTELTITLLQLVYLLCEIREIFSKDNLLSVTRSVVHGFIGMLSSSESSDEIREFLYLSVILKILEKVPPTKGKDPTLDLLMNPSFLDKIRLMHTFKDQLKLPVERLLHRIGSFPVYNKMLLSEIKFALSKEVKLDRVFKGKYDMGERLWRKAPTKSEEFKCYASLRYLEDVTVKGMAPEVLPLISKSVFKQERFGLCRAHFQSRYSKPQSAQVA